MPYFTGKGDKGKSLIGNKKISKASLELEILGILDEFNSLLGLWKNFLKDKKLKNEITQIQNDFFIIQANISWLIYPKFEKPILKAERIKEIEEKINQIEKRKKPPKSFIIPGSNLESAVFDYLRAKVRSVERRMVNFSKKKKVDYNILSYLNRLSSYFYALARLKGKKEKAPSY